MSELKEDSGPEQRPNQTETIIVGNITNSTGVAIGPGASVTIHNHYAATRKRPDYLNMAPELDYFVERPKEFKALKQLLLTANKSDGAGTVGISTTALRGAGGFGKTTLAQALCYDPDIQSAYPDGILWVELGEHPDNLPGKVNALIYHLTDINPGLVDLNAAAAELANTLAEKRCLLVVDDVWNAAHLTPFLRGSPNTTRLITTRSPTTLPPDTEEVAVEAMQQSEALITLVRKLPDWEAYQPSFEALATRLGEWPLLLKLANGYLFRRSKHIGLEKALAFVETILNRRGLTAFDAQNPEQRNEAIAATMAVSLDKLDENKQARFKELAVFPEDLDIPITAVTTLWNQTGGLDEFDTQDLCLELYDTCSLLNRYDGRTLRLHDVIRQYLLDEWGDQTPALHQQLLDAYNPTTDWPTGPNDGYYYQNLAYHLKECGKTAELHTLLLNFDWLWEKLKHTNVPELIADFLVLDSTDQSLGLVKGALQLSNIILISDKNQLAGQLRGRLLSFENKQIQSLVSKADQWRERTWLSPQQACLTSPGGKLVQTLVGHSHTINAVAIIPDGNRVVSGSSDRTLRVWNLETGKAERTLVGHSNRVSTVAVTPDGRRVVSGSWDKTLKVWNLETGEEERTLIGHTDLVTKVAGTPDGRRAVSGSYDKILIVWNLETGKMERTLVGHSDRVSTVAVTPDGKRAVSGSWDKTLKVWNLETGEEERTLVGHTDWVTGVAVTPAGGWVVSGSYDKWLIVWNIETGRAVQRLLEHSMVNAVAVMPDGKRLVSGSWDKTLKVWNLDTGKEEKTLVGHSNSVSAVGVTPDGKRLVSGSWDNTLKVWNLENGEEERTLAGHSDIIYAVAVTEGGSLKGKQAVTSSSDSTLKVWNLEAEKAERTLVGHSNSVYTVRVTPDGKRAVSGSRDNTLKVWNLETGKEERTLAGHTDSVTEVAVTPDGRRVVSASSDGSLKVWDLTTGAEERTLEGHSSLVRAVAVTPDGRWAVSASSDETLKVWDLMTGVEKRTLYGHSGWVLAVAVTPDGRRAVSASSDGTLKVWDLTKGKAEQTLEGHSEWVVAVAVTPDGRWAVSASSDRTLKVWDLTADKAKRSFESYSSLVLAEKSEGVYEDVVILDGKRVVSSSIDRKMIELNLNTDLEMASFTHEETPTCLAIAPDGILVLVGDTVGQIIRFALRIP